MQRMSQEDTSFVINRSGEPCTLRSVSTVRREVCAKQHSVVRAVGMLLYRDPESSKQIYQLMMGEE